MSIYYLDSSFRKLFSLFQQFSGPKCLKIPPKNSFCIESKFGFSRELEQGNKRLNELTLLIVNSGVVPNFSRPQLFVSPQKLRTNTLICLYPIQDNLQDGKWEQVFPMTTMTKVISSSAAENDLFTLFEKNCYTLYTKLFITLY